MITKKDLISEIVTKLYMLDVPDNGCRNLNIELPDGNRISWVSHNKVMISVKVHNCSNVYRNKRLPIYSKDVSFDMLKLINEKL